ncbi:hypothetical protein FIA58_002575 [Flavobacterium jejuense]|uniref:Uncharacterized protein n=1 Tax=Flavobacterium jejuense TaxID=1544455 RepID=A0ABX0IRP0_9FLAO|nr:hypothetical protein [Flavobacterium jejuense]NHN24549.1 hypothetical protein [Flavobacterium jejuense]
MTFEEQIKKLVAEFEAKSKEVAKQLNTYADEIEKNGEVLQDNGTLFSIKSDEYTYNFEWKEVSFHVPIPEIGKNQQRVVLKLPEITMENREIIFDVPTTRMVDKKIGEKPEMTCGWKITKVGFGLKTKTWQCTTKWTPIITAIPEVVMKEHKIITKIPKIVFKDKELIYDMPSITIRMKLVKFNCLVITSVNYDGEEEAIETTSKKIESKQAELNVLSLSFENQLESLTIQMINEEFDTAELKVREQFEPITSDYESSIVECKNTIRDLKNNNAVDALKVEENKLNDLIAKLKKAVEPMENILSDLLKDRLNAIKEVESK